MIHYWLFASKSPRLFSRKVAKGQSYLAQRPRSFFTKNKKKNPDNLEGSIKFLIYHSSLTPHHSLLTIDRCVLVSVIKGQLHFTTVAQSYIRELPRNRAVIDFGPPFLFLFWRRKKEKKTCQLDTPQFRAQSKNPRRCCPGIDVFFIEYLLL